MIIKKTYLTAIALCAICAVGFADGGKCSATGCDANGSVMNGDHKLATTDQDHVKGVVKEHDVKKMPNGDSVHHMVVETDNGDENVTYSNKNGERMDVRHGDRVKVCGRKTMCNGKSMIRGEKVQRDGTLNLNDSVKTN